MRNKRYVVLHDGAISMSWYRFRSGMGTYAGAARRGIHLTHSAFVWPSPRQTPGPSFPYPSDGTTSVHRPGKRQDRHAHILQIGLRQAIAMQTPGPSRPHPSDKLPSGHRPGRHQDRHTHILQIGSHLKQPRCRRAAKTAEGQHAAAPLHGPAARILTRQNLMSGILCRKTKRPAAAAETVEVCS